MISVIIPNFNYAHYLKQRIQSVLNQAYTDIEVILLDDCSTDNSLEVMRKFSDSRIVGVFPNEVNTGSPFRQWQKGIEMAKGEYIWIAEADDFADEHFLQRVIEVIKKEHPAICFTASVMVDSDGNRLNMDFDHWKRRKITEGGYSVFDGFKYAKSHQYWRNHIYNASGVVFRKDIIDNSALDALKMRYSGDWLFWTRLGLHGSVAEIHERLNYFRYHASSVTHKGAYNGFLEDIDIVNTLNKELDINFFSRIRRLIKFRKRWKKMNFNEPFPGSYKLFS